MTQQDLLVILNEIADTEHKIVELTHVVEDANWVTDQITADSRALIARITTQRRAGCTAPSSNALEAGVSGSVNAIRHPILEATNTFEEHAAPIVRSFRLDSRKCHLRPALWARDLGNRRVTGAGWLRAGHGKPRWSDPSGAG
jgi:hypothetical protein